MKRQDSNDVDPALLMLASLPPAGDAQTPKGPGNRGRKSIPPTSLSRRLVTVSAWSSLLGMVIFTGVYTLLLHWYVHRQTDALLLQLAHAEAAHMLSHEGGETSRVAPHLKGAPLSQFQLLLDDKCRPLSPDTPPDEPVYWCDENWSLGSHYFVDVDEGFPIPLRGVVLTQRDVNHKLRRVFVGVDHSSIDASTWNALMLSLPLALVLLLGTVAATALLARRITRALDQLVEDCEDVDVYLIEEKGGRGKPGEMTFAVPHDAPRELLALGHTLQALFERLRTLLHAQRHFIAEAAHELRTPLTALQGELELALRRPRSPEDYREALGSALEDSRRLGRLSEHLLEAARIHDTSIDLSALPLVPILRDCIARLSRPLEENNVLVDEDFSELEGIPLSLHPLSTTRTIDNLLHNALRHAEMKHLRLSLVAESSTHIDLWIEDDGVGLPPEVEARLFTPFARLDSSHSTGGGHGLGLYIAHDLMSRQGGDLSYWPPPQDKTGTRWRLRFRRAE